MEQGPSPAVTVCVPTFNRAHYLRRSLDSILSQTFRDFKVLVVDNVSTDETRDVVQSLSDPRLRYVLNERNLGMVGNWNRCIDLALEQGSPFIAIWHDDDTFEPSILERQLAFFEGHPNVGLVQTSLTFQFANRLAPGRVYPEDRVLNVFQMIEAHLRDAVCGTPSMLARREVYLKAGRFDPKYPIIADLDMWLRALDHFDMGYIADPLCRYRIHPDQGSAVDFEVPVSDLVEVFDRAIQRIAARNPKMDVQRYSVYIHRLCARTILRSAARTAVLTANVVDFDRACLAARRISAAAPIRAEIAALKLINSPAGRKLASSGLGVEAALDAIFSGRPFRTLALAAKRMQTRLKGSLARA